jgi:molybdopterin converting factor small subunit
LKVRVRGLGWLKLDLGEQKLIEAKDHATLLEVLTTILSDDLLNRIVRNGKLSNQAIILINGADANIFGGLNYRLKEGDELTLIPVVHGG